MTDLVVEAGALGVGEDDLHALTHLGRSPPLQPLRSGGRLVVVFLQLPFQFELLFALGPRQAAARLFEEATHARERPSRAGARDKAVDCAVRLSPDLWTGRTVVGEVIGGILELIRETVEGRGQSTS